MLFKYSLPSAEMSLERSNEQKAVEASPPALLVALERLRQDFICSKILYFLLARMGCDRPNKFFTLPFHHIS